MMSATAQIVYSAADLRAARARLGESQSVFGRRFGITRATLAKWEEYGPPADGTYGLLLARLMPEIEETGKGLGDGRVVAG